MMKILKKDFSELVVKKALYWMSEYANWTFKSDKENYIVEFTSLGEKNTQEIDEIFQRLLNDFYLREIIDKSNKNLRSQVIQQALIKVYMHND